MARCWPAQARTKRSASGTWPAAKNWPCGRRHKAPIPALAFHPHGQLLCSGDSDGVIKLWDLAMMHRELTRLGLDWRPGAEAAGAAGTPPLPPFSEMQRAQSAGWTPPKPTREPPGPEPSAATVDRLIANRIVDTGGSVTLGTRTGDYTISRPQLVLAGPIILRRIDLRETVTPEMVLSWKELKGLRAVGLGKFNGSPALGSARWPNWTRCGS